MTASAPIAPAPDETGAYFDMLAAIGAGARGRYVLAGYGENPETGAKLAPLVRHFPASSNVAADMLRCALLWAEEPGRNVYAMAATIRDDLSPSRKGGEDDLRAVLALVADFDARTDPAAGAFADRLSLPPDCVVETSPGSFQALYLFDRPATAAEAKSIAQGLVAVTGCDSCTSDLSHVWRVPGLLNWPNSKKRADGRTPVLSRLVQPWDGKSRTRLEDLRQALPAPAPGHSAPPAGDGAEPSIPIVFDELPEGLRRLIAEGAPEGQRSEQFHSAIAQLKEHGADADAIEALLSEHPGGIAAKFAGRLRGEIERCYVKAAGRVRAEDEFEVLPPDPAARPTIKIVGGNLHLMTSEAEAALVAAGEHIYVRGSRLVRPIVETVDAAHGRKTVTVRLVPVTEGYLIDRLGHVATWLKHDARSKEKWARADPPRPVALALLAREGSWSFRPLAGVLTCPTLRPDGSLLAAPGYDRATRLLLIDPPAMPAIPQRPTRADAEAALALLDGLLAEFPFEDAASRAVALSAIITPIVRGALPVAPLHATTAPAAGSGKSFVFDIVSTIQTGQRCPVISAGASEEETEKRLGAALLAGQPIVSIDNLNGDLSGDALCQFVERPLLDIRPLGQSALARIESRATVFASGNNLRVVGDMVRRVLLCSLDANAERPELRQFDRDPLALILADRGRYIAAALTIVRAYVEAGYPGVLPALASFSEWSRLVRSALTWLGCADPLDTMERARADDPETVGLQRVVAAWLDVIGPEVAVTAGELAEAATRFRDEKDSADPLPLREALEAVAGSRSRASGPAIETKSLGRWLLRRKGRVVLGFKIHAEQDAKRKQLRWSLWPAKGVAGLAGLGGDVPSPSIENVTLYRSPTDSFLVGIGSNPAKPRKPRQAEAEGNSENAEVDLFS